MSGHSKWASIKHKKAQVDAKRGQLFTKLGRAITVAAREGGGDLEGNATLANAVQKARDMRMPKDNIERAILRGTGEGADSSTIETVNYEGYGPGGVALLVEVLTDNRNRTAADVRHLFSRYNGSLGEPGSVSWIFEKKGVVLLDGSKYSEEDLMPAIDAGAEDVDSDGDTLRVVCDQALLKTVRESLGAANLEFESADITMEPKSTVEVERGDAKGLFNLIGALEEHDDVSSVYANFDIAEDVLEEVAQ